MALYRHREAPSLRAAGEAIQKKTVDRHGGCAASR